MKYRDLTTAAAILADAPPPEFRISPEREAALANFDQIFSEADSERCEVLGRFYRRRVDQALREIAEYDGRTPRLWKLYSSGVIIKDQKSTSVIDVNRGCVPACGRTRLLMSRQQIAALAGLADVYCCTHSHEDHLSPELCDAFARQKKSIVMPMEAIKRWSIKNATPVENCRLANCRTFLNWQGNDEGGLDCAMYLFTLSNGKNLFVRGDIYHGKGFEACLAQLRHWRKNVDYALMSHYFTSGDSPIAALDKTFSCRFIPIHEWEFSHRPMGKPGAATQDFAELYRQFAVPYAGNRAQMLFWGESIALD